MTNRIEIQVNRYFLFALTAYLLFFIYGNLVPFNFRPRLLSEAWTTFVNIRFMHPGIISRSDWAANFLLGIPLSFLGLGYLCNKKGRVSQVAMSLAVFVVSIALSCAIEFTQLFFPPRCASLNDIMAQAAGAAVGVITWWCVGPKILEWLSHLKTAKYLPTKAYYLFWLYLVILVFYNLMPLDLTLSPVEIYHKWKAGRINLIPFAFSKESLAWLTYELVSDTAIWLPVASFLVIFGKKSAFSAWFWVVSAASCIEFLQIFVFTRVTDITDIITAAIGGGIGAWIGLWFQSNKGSTTSVSVKPGISRSLIGGLMAIVGWTVVLIVIFWFPFNFNTDRSFLIGRLRNISLIPLEIYFYNTELRAITEVLRKTLFFAPIGMIISFMIRGITKRIPHVITMIFVITIIGSISLMIEIGQIFLPEKVPDVTDWLLETFGGVGGYLLFDRFRIYGSN